MAKTDALLYADFDGLCFVNLVDFDMLYGHRNDAVGYARALEEFDTWLGKAKALLKDDDILIITADHGCDPETPSTDHSREYTPLIVFGKQVKAGDMGVRDSFADIAATILVHFGLENATDGESFYSLIRK